MASDSNRSETALVRYRNRDIHSDDLTFVRSVVRKDPSRPRREIAQEICEAWDWRQASGGWSVSACADLLYRLEAWGHIEGYRRGSGAVRQRRLPLLPLDLIPIASGALPGNAQLSTLVVRPIIRDEMDGWRVYMQRYHYLGFGRPIGEHILYAAFLEGEWVALLGWAAAALHAPLRDEFIGWDERTKRRRLHLIANNVRFLVFSWARLKNLASKILGNNLGRLSADWQQRWNHPIHLAETFVDTARFAGTCYRASNWKYLGQTAGRTKRSNAYLSTGTPKALYVYELHRDTRRLLRGIDE